MKIRLLENVPVEPRHKMTKGRVLEAEEEKGSGGRGTRGYWVKGDKGTPVLIRRHECEAVGANDLSAEEEKLLSDSCE